MPVCSADSIFNKNKTKITSFSSVLQVLIYKPTLQDEKKFSKLISIIKNGLKYVKIFTNLNELIRNEKFLKQTERLQTSLFQDLFDMRTCLMETVTLKPEEELLLAKWMKENLNESIKTNQVTRFSTLTKNTRVLQKKIFQFEDFSLKLNNEKNKQNMTVKLPYILEPYGAFEDLKEKNKIQEIIGGKYDLEEEDKVDLEKSFKKIKELNCIMKSMSRETGKFNLNKLNEENLNNLARNLIKFLRPYTNFCEKIGTRKPEFYISEELVENFKLLMDYLKRELSLDPIDEFTNKMLKDNSKSRYKFYDKLTKLMVILEEEQYRFNKKRERETRAKVKELKNLIQNVNAFSEERLENKKFKEDYLSKYTSNQISEEKNEINLLKQIKVKNLIESKPSFDILLKKKRALEIHVSETRKKYENMKKPKPFVKIATGLSLAHELVSDATTALMMKKKEENLEKNLKFFSEKKKEDAAKIIQKWWFSRKIDRSIKNSYEKKIIKENQAKKKITNKKKK